MDAVTVPDDKRGCLQDVHWSHGSFGYFATYSLGSFYAAQFYAQALRSFRAWKRKSATAVHNPCCSGFDRACTATARRLPATTYAGSLPENRWKPNSL
jgi:hypothetical protein